jgi:starch phosphorylase
MLTGAPDPASARVAYFSMEIALEPGIPTYAGGLGVLAGDTLRSAADLGVPMVAVTLVHRHGYFDQILDAAGHQSEGPEPWDPAAHAERMDAAATVTVEGRAVHVRAWRYCVRGLGGHVVPVFLLDTDCPGNSEWDRTLTNALYGGDEHYRLCQEIVLGIGGVRMLRALGHTSLSTFHMNEGHSSFLALALLEEKLGHSRLASAGEADIRDVQKQCVFTTHTPVPAGHDQFPRDLVARTLGPDGLGVLEATHCCPESVLNMTFLALRFSRYINGVAMHHGAISHGMFPNYPIRAITNGVHAVTWTCPELAALYDRHIPEWRRDNLYLRYSIGISLEEIQQAHASAKQRLLHEISTRAGVALDAEVFTIGFARRAAAYKRFDLLFSSRDRLKTVSERAGPLQILFGGRAHPRDGPGKEQIRRVFEHAAALNGPRLRIVYLEDYKLDWARLLTAGVDLWLNTPLRPLEASGTSGMKAALNGVPSLSILDGWWIEGCLEGVTGWAIGRDSETGAATADEADSLYEKLEHITGLYYERRDGYAAVMRGAIALNGSFFNTQRMLSQYVANAYLVS